MGGPSRRGGPAARWLSIGRKGLERLGSEKPWAGKGSGWERLGGGFRGTSAIGDAVDETWALRKPTDEERGVVGAHSRLITIEKSRSGRSGTQLVMQMQDDLSFTISDFTPEVDETNTSPASVTDRVLQKLRVVYPESRSKDDLVCDPLIDGKPAAIHKSLQRLEKRGLVVSNAPKGSQTKNWTAVLARGEGESRT